MNCAEFESLLPDFNRPETRGTPEYDHALAHARRCDSCSPLLAEAESLEGGLRALAADDFRRQAPARMEANLLREFRTKHAAVGRPRIYRRIAAMGIAAAVLLALGLSLRNRVVQTPGSKVVAQVSPVAVPVERNNPDKPMAAEGPRPSTAKSVRKGRRPIPSALPNEPDRSNDAADFIALPFADDPRTLEDGAVVRVEMPRAALASFGFPVMPAPGNGRVRADLLVAPDGTPQAIRLVSYVGSNHSH